MRIGYARVSTRDQHPEAQSDALTAAGCERVFTDKASGKLGRRPELDEALRGLRAGDQLVVTKLDRLGRSLEHLIDLSNDLQGREVDLVVLDQGIDTSTAVGRMFFQILGAIAEFCARHTKEELYEEGQKRRIAVTPINTAGEFIEMEQTKARGLFVEYSARLGAAHGCCVDARTHRGRWS